MSRARPWLELLRLSNAPTVITNALTGVALGLISLEADATADLPRILPVMSLAMVMLYAGGMALNDYFDRAIDANERPERPIPSGRIPPRNAAVLGFGLLAGGAAFCAAFGLMPFIFGLALAATIVLYNLLHAKWAGSVVLMGLCRALVYFTCASAVTWPLTWRIVGPLGGVLMVYIIALSVIARVEAKATIGKRGLIAWLLPVIAISPLIVVRPDAWSWWPVAVGALMLAWLIASMRHVRQAPPRISQAVMAWIAGIALVDAFILALLGEHGLVIVAVGAFFLTIAGHRKIAGS